MIITIKTKKKQEIFDITKGVEKVVAAANVKNGLCLIYVPHATAAIIINENYDPSVCDDILMQLNKLVPEHANYKHDAVDRNAHAHIKAAFLGPSEIVAIENGKLQLGRWQGIALAEFDGPRERSVIIKILK